MNNLNPFFQKLTPAAIGVIETFTRPAVASGLVTKQEVRDALAILRQATKPPVHHVQEPNRFLTAKQAATVCSCSRRTIARMIADGTLPSVHLRPGCKKSLRIRTIDLERLMPAGIASAREGAK